MADTNGLMRTRGEWIDATTNGETNLSHKDWYDQKYGGKSAEQTEEEAQKQIKAGYDKVAGKRHGLIGRT